MNGKVITRTIFLILMIVNCVTIFIFSNQNGEESGNLSGSILKDIIDVLPNTKELDESEKEILVEKFQVVIRKGAHFSIYTLLGFLTMGFVNTFNIDNKKKVIFSFLFGVLYAVTDEIHQLFSSGRTAKLLDVGIDSLGVIFGILIISFIIYLINRKKDKKTKIITN